MPPQKNEPTDISNCQFSDVMLEFVFWVLKTDSVDEVVW